ncbi:hypothetical protein V7S43_004973 [Phytophthora oleae]|uniref:Uncharacterized protein n=1 Tax=Phytophthora oleae TaxID=2107226 RepID=A0ABD3FRU9_9STRA
MSDEILMGGVTTFEGWAGTFRFVIFEDRGLNIVLVDGSGKQWGTGYLATDQYVTTKIRIANLEVKDNANLFLNI